MDPTGPLSPPCLDICSSLPTGLPIFTLLSFFFPSCLFLSFLSKLHAQRGAQTHDLEMNKSRMLSQLSQPGAPLSLYPFISSLTPVHFQHIKEIHLKCMQISSLQNPTVASHFLNSKIKLFRHDLPLTTSLSVQSHLLLVDSYPGQDALPQCKVHSFISFRFWLKYHLFAPL